MRSSSPSATKIRLTGSLPCTALMARKAFSCTICGPLELVAPRPNITLGNAPCWTICPSNGACSQASGWVTGIVSYIQ